MKLKLLRFSTGNESTYGALYIEDEFQCFTLENAFHKEKINKKTRINGDTEYKISLRDEGGYHEKYRAKFGSMHRGMLYLNDVDNFEWILIHIGNEETNTDGCILVGNTIGSNNQLVDGFIGDSTNAYIKLYPKVRDAILNGENVILKIIDFDEKKEGAV